MNKDKLKEEIQKVITRAICTKYPEAAEDILILFEMSIPESVQGVQEPIVDKEYEITKVYQITSNGKWVYDVLCNKLCSSEGKPLPGTFQEQWVSKPHLQIQSIKRLQDGEVFSIGDKLSTGITIDTIEESQNYVGGVALRQSDGSATAIEVARHYQPLLEETMEIIVGDTTYLMKKSDVDNINRILQEGIAKEETPVQDKVLLITEDGKAITDNFQKVFGVSKEEWDTADIDKWDVTGSVLTTYKWFSTSEARYEWILYNKPCLSQKEIIEKILIVLPKDYKERVEFVLGISTIDKLKQ